MATANIIQLKENTDALLSDYNKSLSLQKKKDIEIEDLKTNLKDAQALHQNEVSELLNETHELKNKVIDFQSANENLTDQNQKLTDDINQLLINSSDSFNKLLNALNHHIDNVDDISEFESDLIQLVAKIDLLFQKFNQNLPLLVAVEPSLHRVSAIQLIMNQYMIKKNEILTDSNISEKDQKKLSKYWDRFLDREMLELSEV